MEHVKIPKDIAPDEPCVRCVIPGKIKKNRILPDALLPREERNDASLLRLNYTTVDFCVAHGKSLDPSNRLGALVKFTQTMVDSVNQWATTDDAIVENNETKEKSACGISAFIEYSPMDNDQYVDRELDYYTDSPITLPMHADLLFREPLEKGLVRTRTRMYTKELINRAEKAIMDGDNLGEWVV